MADYGSVKYGTNPDFFLPGTTGVIPGSIGYSSGLDMPGLTGAGALSSGSSASPSKPGFDWMAAGAAASDFMGGVGDLIRGIRGDQPVYRMAGSRLQDYLSSQKQDAYLEQLLKSIIGKNTGLFEDFDPKKGLLFQ